MNKFRRMREGVVAEGMKSANLQRSDINDIVPQ